MHPLNLAPHLPPTLTAPLALRLDAARAQRVAPLLAEHPEIRHLVRDALHTLQNQPDSDAERTVERYAAALLLTLRRHDGQSWPVRLDRLVASDIGELMDRPWTSAQVKQREMQALDRLNRLMGSYTSWSRLVRGIVGDGPAHVVDLAAGSGGFLRHVARHERPLHLRMTSTDLEPIYVQQGKQLAQDLPVQFAVQDALRLTGLDDVDLFVCTQSTHHLAPGMLVRLIAEAVRVAKKGLLVVDLLRSGGNVAGALLATTLTQPYLPLVVDGMQSIRRAYLPSELRLLATLAGAKHIETRTISPAFAVLHARS